MLTPSTPLELAEALREAAAHGRTIALTGSDSKCLMAGPKEPAEVEIATTGEPAGITLSVDRDTIRADRRDVAHVTVKVVDAEGRVHPEADNEIAFQIEGAGRLIGLDSGNLADMSADYKGKTRKVFHGMCLAIVQSLANPGEIRLTATSAGLKTAGIAVTTRV